MPIGTDGVGTAGVLETGGVKIPVLLGAEGVDAPVSVDSTGYLFQPPLGYGAPGRV